MLRRAMLALILTLPTLAGAAPDGNAPPTVAEADLQTGVEGLRYVDLDRGAGEPLQAGEQATIVVQLWTQPDAPPVRIGAPDAPLAVVVGGGTLIRGLDLGLVGMRVGGVRYLDIPASLASGAGTPMVAVVAALDGAQGSEAEAPRSNLPNRGGPTTSLPTREPPAAPPEVSDWDAQRNGVRTADLVVGTGDSPEKGDRVIVEYTGWVAETGERFDSSLARAEAFAFTYGGGQVILGWEKGLRGMKVGGTRVISIPSYLGYGSAGAGSIPPHADLVFQVQLLELQ